MPPKKAVDDNCPIVINNESDLADHFHKIHDLLRDNFGLYGKSALQFFNFFFVLKMIDELIENGKINCVENDGKIKKFNKKYTYKNFKRQLDDDMNTSEFGYRKLIIDTIKEIRKKKNELTPQIIDFMDKFEINDLNTNGGKLKFTKSLQTKPLNKQFLISKLGDFFKDFAKGEKIASYILENRDKAEVVKLKRVQNKKEFNL